MSFSLVVRYEISHLRIDDLSLKSGERFNFEAFVLMTSKVLKSFPTSISEGVSSHCKRASSPLPHPATSAL
jgi:hypothetical protein